MTLTASHAPPHGERRRTPRSTTRLLVVGVVGLLSASLVLGTGLLVAGPTVSAARALAADDGPALAAVQATQTSHLRSQAAFVEAFGAQDPLARTAALNTANQSSQAIERSWTRYLAHRTATPTEEVEVQRYEAASERAGALSIELVTADPAGTAASDLEAMAAAQALASTEVLEALYSLETIAQDRVSDASQAVTTGIASVKLRMAAVLAVALVANSVAILLSARRARREGLARLSESVALRDAWDSIEFEGSVQRGLELARTEQAVFETVARATALVGVEDQAALLIADSSHAHFEQAMPLTEDDHRLCTAPTPSDCPAVGHGATYTFRDGNQIDSCPFLRNEDQAATAVCVPVSIGGRSTGVLHLRRPATEPIDSVLSERFSVIGRRVGDRLTAVRVLATAQAQASTDPLTGLANRRTLDDAVAQLSTDGSQHVVAFADLDHFKDLNDTYGHETGDRALRLFAGVLRSSVRPTDIVARHGGEEFVAVLPKCSLADAVVVFEKLRSDLARALRSAEVPPFTVTIGLAVVRSGEPFVEAIRRADELMLAGKALGRDRVYTDPLLAEKPAKRSEPRRPRPAHR